MFHDEFECIDDELMAMMPMVSKNNVIFHLIDSSKFKALNEIKEILERE